LTAAAATLDPRTTLARPDLAEQALEGIVRAAAFRPVQPMHCAVPVIDLHAGPEAGDHPVDQLIFGEAFDVLEARSDRVWGRARRDGVVGWVQRSALAAGAPLPTHRVDSTGDALPLNALVTDRGGATVLAPIGGFAAEPVEVAGRLIGVPHRLGARSSLATDCAGLIQQALYACGRAAPRYADQQAELGEAVRADDAGRGDLVIWLKADEAPWRGHSGFLLDADRVLHATGHHGAVVVEARAEAEARYRAGGFAAPVFRRV
jgi:hypothetical protein